MATAEEKYAILISQRGCCLYCGKPLDSVVFRKGESVDLELQWDHAIPRAIRVIDEEENIVASCQICNNIKNDLVFETVDEAREWIYKRRERKGYSDQRVAWYEAEHPVIPEDMKCPRCGQWFQIKSALVKHVNTNPSSCAARKMQNERRKKRADERSEKKRAKKAEIKDSKDRRSVICERCGRKFINLGSHMRNRHLPEITAEEEVKRLNKIAERDRNKTGRPASKRPTLPVSRRTPESLRRSELRAAPPG